MSVFSEAQVSWESDARYMVRIKGQVKSLRDAIAWWKSKARRDSSAAENPSLSGLKEVLLKQVEYYESQIAQLNAKINDKEDWIAAHG